MVPRSMERVLSPDVQKRRHAASAFSTALDADGTREVVGAAERHNQSRNLLERQSAKMTMNGAVAAKDERRIGLVSGIEFVAGEQVDARHFELPDVVLFGDRSKKGNSAHGATFAHGRANAK